MPGTAAELLAEGIVCEAAGSRILLSHGDKWCTLDEDYQAFRAQVRDETFQLSALKMTVAERIDYAKKARAQSGQAKKVRTREVMDVVESEVAAEAALKNCTHVIHVFDNYTRTVIPDWDLDDKARSRRGWVELNSTGTPQVVLSEYFF